MVLVSDGTSLLKAVFEGDGIAAFEKSSGRKFGSIKGGIITSAKSNLVCCPKFISHVTFFNDSQVFNKDADPSDALTLHILAFKLYGAEGARTFGSPVDISPKPELEHIFHKLNRLLSGPLASSLPSLPADSEVKDSTPSQMLNTQFATQISATQRTGMNARRDQSSQNRRHLILEKDGENDAAKSTSSSPSSSKDGDEGNEDRPRRAVDRIDQEAVIATSKRLQETTKTIFYDAFQADNPFQANKRVPRKFARIPREQQSLLDNDASWYNPSARVAYLPDSVRQGLAKFIEQQETVATESSENSDDESISNHSKELEPDSPDSKIINTISLYSSPPKYRSGFGSHHKTKGSIPEQAREDSPSKVSQNPAVDLAVPIAMGDLADDEDEDMPLSPLPPPSTVVNKSTIIQVKRTPCLPSLSRESLSNRHHGQEGREDSSSNPSVIPATHNISSELWQSSIDTRQTNEAPEQIPQPMMHSSPSEAKPPRPSYQKGQVQPRSRGLSIPRSSPAAILESTSLLFGNPETSLVGVSAHEPETEAVANVSLNLPSPFIPSLGSIPHGSPRMPVKMQKRKRRGRTAEDKFFADREVEDPKVAVNKIRKEFLAKYEHDTKAQEELPLIVPKVDSSCSQPRNDMPPRSGNIIQKSIEIPATRFTSQKPTQQEPSTPKQATVIPSTSYEPEDLSVFDNPDGESVVADFIDADEINPIFAHETFISGSSAGPDEDLQLVSSPQQIDSLRQSLVDSQELVLSIESESFGTNVARDEDKKELCEDKINREAILFGDEDDVFEDPADGNLEQVREETDFRQRSPTSEEGFQYHPLPGAGEYMPKHSLRDGDEDEGLGQQGLRDNLDLEAEQDIQGGLVPELIYQEELSRPDQEIPKEFGPKEVDQKDISSQEKGIQKESNSKSIDQEEFRQEVEQEVPAEVIYEEVVQERSSQTKVHPDDTLVSFFDKYKSQYPDYTGTSKDFTAALVYLEWLLENRKLLPNSFYDDFVNFYPEEYLALGGDKLNKVGYELFNEKVEEAIFKAKIIYPGNLQLALSTLDEADVQEERARFERPEKVVADRSRSAARALKSSTPASPVVAQARAPTPAPVHSVEDKGVQAEVEGGVEGEPEQLGRPSRETPEPAEHPEHEPDIAENVPIFETMVHKPKPVYRQPFFDTPSQALPAKRKEAPMNLDSSGSSAKKHRTLPWQIKSSPAKVAQKQGQFQDGLRTSGVPRRPSPELGDDTFHSKSHRPSTRYADPLRPISPPPLKDPNRRKTIGTDKVIETKSKPRHRTSMASTIKVDVGPSNPSVFADFLRKNRESLLRHSRSPSLASSAHSSSSKRKASRKKTDGD